MDHPDKALQEVDLLFARRAVGDERAVELHGVHGNVQDGVQHRIPRPEVIDGRVDAHAPQRDEKRLRVLVLVHGGGLDEFYDAAPAAVVGERVIAGKGRVPRAVQQVLATEAERNPAPELALALLLYRPKSIMRMPLSSAVFQLFAQNSPKCKGAKFLNMVAPSMRTGETLRYPSRQNRTVAGLPEHPISDQIVSFSLFSQVKSPSKNPDTHDVTTTPMRTRPSTPIPSIPSPWTAARW